MFLLQKIIKQYFVFCGMSFSIIKQIKRCEFVVDDNIIKINLWPSFFTKFLQMIIDFSFSSLKKKSIFIPVIISIEQRSKNFRFLKLHFTRLFF
jgi:hypothetical protein